MKVIIAGGGTGGHLYPALAIADELCNQEPNTTVMFVGTHKGIEARVIPKTGYPLSMIPASGITRGKGLNTLFENLKFPFRLLESLWQSVQLLKKENPDVVVGTGGFVSAPIVLAAQLQHKPTLIQEQNAFPGLATRLLAMKASEVHLSFEESKKAIKRAAKVFITGNPARKFSEISKRESREFFGLEKSKKTLLVFGGSLGARAINHAILKWASQLQPFYNLIWQTGKLDYPDVKKEVQKSTNLWFNDYIERMDMAYAAADLVLCRSGASTIAELCNLGKPSILVPYPFATDNHQYFNAKSLSDKNAAILIDNKYIDHQDSFLTLTTLLNDDQALERMSSNAKKLGKPNAAEQIAQRIFQLGQVKS